MPATDQFGYKKKGKRKVKRPPLITILCIAVIAYGFWSIISSYIGIYTGFGTLYPAINALMIVFSFVAISGVWSMEKWGPVSFAIVLALKLLSDAMWGKFNPWILLGIIPAAIFFMVFSKMKNTD
jgi:Na+/melibiose symporter-like transporter